MVKCMVLGMLICMFNCMLSCMLDCMLYCMLPPTCVVVGLVSFTDTPPSKGVDRSLKPFPFQVLLHTGPSMVTTSIWRLVIALIILS